MLIRVRNLSHVVLASITALQGAVAADVPAPAIPRFVEETDSAGLQSRFEGEVEFMVGGGVATFDCDADGLPEVYVTAGVNKGGYAVYFTDPDGITLEFVQPPV